MKKSFTFVEMLIAISVIALISVVAILLLDPTRQIKKVWDGQRKHDLSTLRRTFEDYYNDKNHYPKPDDVCFDPPETKEEYCICRICGLNRNNIVGYLSRLHCDPQHPQRDYLYQFDCDETEGPTWYRIWAQLSEEGKQGASSYGAPYNVSVASPNVDNPETLEQPPACPADPGNKYCLKSGYCNNCGSFANCSNGESCDSPVQLYTDFMCTTVCNH